jgi:hypothetical protein
MLNFYDTYSKLVKPYTTTERERHSFPTGANNFSTAVDELKTHASSRTYAVGEHLSKQ